MMVQIAKRTGAGKVIMVGTRDYRLEEARKWGADCIFNVKDTNSRYYTRDLKAAIFDVTHGQGADRAINPTGDNAAFEQAIDVTAGAAILVHFGLPNADDVIHIPADALQGRQADPPPGWRQRWPRRSDNKGC
jgi:threonine dehydrogenase-like Zn-dependent dehydrogenase